jgi:hypothetical protein
MTLKNHSAVRDSGRDFPFFIFYEKIDLMLVPLS